MGHIDNTWLAYAFDREASPDQIEASLGRVEAHYSELCVEPLIRSAIAGPSLGMALWSRADERLRWPLWASGQGLTIAATNALTGCERLVGDVSAVRVAAALRDDPDGLGELNPPFALGIADHGDATLTIVNDFLGAARLFQLRSAAGWVWSNRLGALPIFAGTRPVADPEAWAVLAAAGWFLGSATPILGARKVAPGSVIVARATKPGVRVDARQSAAVRALVAPRCSRLHDSATAAAEQAVSLARSVADLWTVPALVNLSGGRDSRISAAGAIAAGVDAEYRTMDIEPGEVDTARRLVAAAPWALSHSIASPERGDPPDDLDRRIRAKHLVHDGVANPMSVIRGPTNLPQSGFSRPLITGHGGELAHGFYYDRSSLRRLRRGPGALVARLERTARQAHSAAGEDSYAAFMEVVGSTLEDGRAHGIEGPTLLDYFYLAQRLPFRAGLGTRSDRYSACVTPAFVRAAFDLSPRQRSRWSLHRAVLKRLAPEWRSIPFFHASGGRLPRVNRDRIWEKPRHSEQLEAMLDRRSLWDRLFVPERVLAMWAEVRRGEGHAHYEAVLLRIAWRVAFEDHLRLLGERAEL